MQSQLTGLDSAFLSLETRSAPLHVAAAIVLEPSPASGEAVSHQRIREHLAPRLLRLPVFRRGIREVPLGLDHPFWDESELDLDAHLHRVAVPAPGSRRELAELVGRLASQPLERDRPLWELWVIEGLAGRRTALLAKVHHALIDGVAGAEILAHLLDVRPDGEGDRLPESSSRRRPAPATRTLLSAAARGLASLPLRAARQAWKSAGMAARVARAVVDGVSRSDLSLAAPDSPLNGAVSSRRVVALGEVALADLKDVKRAFDATVNDVVLAATAGALRRCLRAWGEEPQEPLVAAVPVAVPRDDEAGNAVSAMRVELPVQLADPVERLREIRRSASQAKRLQQAAGNELLAGWAELATPWLVSGLTDLYSRLDLADRHPPLANLVVSNVRGPDSSLYCARHEVGAIYPLGPIYEGWGLNVTILSYAGRVFLGLTACPSVVREPGSIRDAFDASVAELRRAARRASSGTRAPRARPVRSAPARAMGVLHGQGQA